MKLDCEVVRDLFPLYEEALCSARSKALVDAHLKECESCQRLLRGTRQVEIPRAEPSKAASDRAIKKGFHKIRIRWWISLLLAAAVIPLLILGWNQYRGSGVCYTNLKELTVAKSFMRQISAGNYEKAYQYFDLEGLRQDWLDNWFEEAQLENLEADGKRYFCEYGRQLEEFGGITDCAYVGVSDYGRTKDGRPVYLVVFQISFNGKRESFSLSVTDRGVDGILCGGSWLKDPLAQFAVWSEFLWEEYQGCTFDPVEGTYIYPDP